MRVQTGANRERAEQREPAGFHSEFAKHFIRILNVATHCRDGAVPGVLVARRRRAQVFEAVDLGVHVLDQPLVPAPRERGRAWHQWRTRRGAFGAGSRCVTSLWRALVGTHWSSYDSISAIFKEYVKSTTQKKNLRIPARKTKLN
jgi:hypothetical protein